MNQCDGCMAGLPIEDGIHMKDGKPWIGCTKDKYVGPIPERREYDGMVSEDYVICEPSQEELNDIWTKYNLETKDDLPF